jgi:hypothetical protein
MQRLFMATLLAGAALAAQPAQAALTLAGPDCAASDIGVAAGPDFACAGFFRGNLSSNATSADQTAALALLGLTFPNAFASAVEKISSVPNPKTTLDFVTPLSGISYIGIHWGNVPYDLANSGKVNNVTSFYKFDAGTSLDKLTLAFSATSNATLYKITTPPVVPEPATWAMMLIGFAAVGYALRRRRRVTVNFA